MKNKNIMLMLFLLFFTKVYAISDWNIENGIHYITEDNAYYTVRVNNDAELNVSGGDVDSIYCYDTSAVNIYGWSNSAPIPSRDSLHIVANDYSVINFFQGNTNGQLNAYGNSTVHIYGKNLNFTSQYLTGIWTDGTDFSLYMRGHFELPSQIIFHEIPEPATLALLAFGGLLMRRKK